MISIMLDPGHAGEYYNASPVVSGYYESRMTWSLALKLKASLESRGFKVGLTRQSMYEDPELTERGRRARGYDLFLSLHSNAAGSEVPDAPWIIHYASDSATTLDERSREVASALGPVISRVMGTSAPYYYTKSCDFDRDGDGRINDEYYGVLFGAKSVGVPGVILEHSFHTNKKSTEWLLDEGNLARLAEEEAEALAKFYGMEEEMTENEKREFSALKNKVEKLEGSVCSLEEKYDFTTACPEWARGTVHKLLQRGALKGDEHGRLRLTYDMVRMLVILDRLGMI